MIMDETLMGQLSQRLNDEFYSAYKYFAMATYFTQINLDGFAKFAMNQAKEEMEHARKIYDYHILRNIPVLLSAIEPTDISWINTLNVVEEALAHEKLVTEKYKHFYELAQEKKDHALVVFLEWFIEEQVEEESKFTNLLEKVRISQGCACGVAQLDRFLLSM